MYTCDQPGIALRVRDTSSIVVSHSPEVARLTTPSQVPQTPSPPTDISVKDSQLSSSQDKTVPMDNSGQLLSD